ncbi:acetyl-CoA synthetase-like protein, partial [Polychaeton citri CBS 116435]
MLDDAHHQQILKWNSKLPSPPETSVHDQVHDQALQRPDDNAVCGWDGSLSFHELDGFATRLAQAIRKLGSGKGSFVPFCFEKSTWAIVAMLGILKSGAALVPLDPAYPTDRSQEIIQRTQATFVLTSRACQSLFPFTQTMTVSRETVESQPVCQRLDHTSTDTGKADPAYVYFTSGSTGRPKGVVILHQSFTLSMLGCIDRLRLNSSTRMLQFTSYTFDPALMEIFSPLYAGGCVCVPSPTQRIEGIADFMTSMEVNAAFFTPTFLKTIKPQTLPRLHSLLIGGEPLNDGCIAEWADNTYAVNGYGPTE